MKLGELKVDDMKIKHVLYIICGLILFASAFISVSRDAVPLVNQGNEPGRINSIPYNKDGINAQYPELAADGSRTSLQQWNRIISDDFNKILKIYSFHPIPEPSQAPSGTAPEILKLTYAIKLNDSKYTSILYLAAFSSIFSAHPSELVYTTNIDKGKSSRLKLSDIVNLNEAFAKDFKTWDLAEADMSEEIKKGIEDYMSGLSDEDLLMGMKSADIIGSGNLLGIFTYLTPDRLGISIGVPNYLGDHVEFEKEYSLLKDFLKPEFTVPSGE